MASAGRLRRALGNGRGLSGPPPDVTDDGPRPFYGVLARLGPRSDLAVVTDLVMFTLVPQRGSGNTSKVLTQRTLRRQPQGWILSPAASIST